MRPVSRPVRRRTRALGLTLAVGLGLSLALAGCADSGDSGDGAASAGPSGAANQAASFPVTAGGVTVEQRPQRIVSLSPSATEMLFAIGAGSQVTAVDDNSNYPPEVPKSDLSGYEPNAEAIAAKDPDLVVISNDTNKVVAALTTLKIPVYQAPAATTLDDTYRQLTELGALTGNAAAASASVQQLKDDIAALVKTVPARTGKLTYYYELDPTFYSVTAKTFIGSLFALAGLDNIADAADPDGKAGGYPQLSPEVIIKANPDMIFLADTKCCQQSAQTVAARSGWAAIGAVKNGQVIALDDDIASRWGPRVVDLVRSIVEAVRKVPA